MAPATQLWLASNFVTLNPSVRSDDFVKVGGGGDELGLQTRFSANVVHSSCYEYPAAQCVNTSEFSETDAEEKLP